MKRNFLLWVFLPGFFTVPSSAQVDISPGVARISLIQGDVSAQRGDTGDWAAAALNQPLVGGDRISKEGVYRVEVHGFETQVIVRAGAADISTPQGNTHVEVSQAATIRGTTDEAGIVLGGAPSNDIWDSWNNDRDGEIRNAQSWNYTNRYYVGSEDLDAHGHWINVPDYGRAWSPTVAGNWSPYRAGRWVSEPYWGWTWVSHEPWGWTPYHYGRWFLYGKSW